jgi:hypothetical protein
MGASTKRLGSVAYAHCSKNRFLTVYRPFFTVFLATPTRDELDESGLVPFSGSSTPLKR